MTYCYIIIVLFLWLDYFSQVLYKKYSPITSNNHKSIKYVVKKHDIK